jgi:tRNA(fMet)-specific endonuclease VapC
VIRYLIDADSAIYSMIDAEAPISHRIAAADAGDIGISAITFAEIALGTNIGKPPPSEVLDAFVSVIPLLPFDESAARKYSQLPFKRARFDRLLAAHALSIGAVIITNNEADFVDVLGVRVENWTV